MGIGKLAHRLARYQYIGAEILVEILKARGHIDRVSVYRVADSFSGTDIAGQNLATGDSDTSAQPDTRKPAVSQNFLDSCCV